MKNFSTRLSCQEVSQRMIYNLDSYQENKDTTEIQVDVTDEARLALVDLANNFDEEGALALKLEEQAHGDPKYIKNMVRSILLFYKQGDDFRSSREEFLISMIVSREVKSFSADDFAIVLQEVLGPDGGSLIAKSSILGKIAIGFMTNTKQLNQFLENSNLNAQVEELISKRIKDLVESEKKK